MTRCGVTVWNPGGIGCDMVGNELSCFGKAKEAGGQPGVVDDFATNARAIGATLERRNLGELFKLFKGGRNGVLNLLGRGIMRVRRGGARIINRGAGNDLRQAQGRLLWRESGVVLGELVAFVAGARNGVFEPVGWGELVAIRRGVATRSAMGFLAVLDDSTK